MDIFWSDILTYLLRAASAGGRGAGMVQVAGYKYDLNGLSSPPSPAQPSAAQLEHACRNSRGTR